MAKGIQITNKKNIPDAKGTDFTVNSLFEGSLKIHKIITFNRGGDLTTISSAFGVNAYVQRYTHGLKYVPAYLAYLVYGDINSPTLIKIPYNNSISVAGDSHFANVTADQIIVGFDTADANINYIRVILFAEKLANS